MWQWITTPATPAKMLLAKAKANKKRIVALSVAFAVILVAALAWFFISQTNNRKADEAAATADMTLVKGVPMPTLLPCPSTSRLQTCMAKAHSAPKPWPEYCSIRTKIRRSH